LDLRVYNRPISSEVAGIWIEDGCEGSGRTYERESIQPHLHHGTLIHCTMTPSRM
ncbi:hypothetical protein Leryth_022804, partial [Lithospermum erythrorhizon]